MTDLALAPTRIGGYDVVETLSRPGPTAHLLARPPARLGLLSDRVLVKVLDGRHDAQRFHQVTEALRGFAAVRSPHLVTLHEAGLDDGRIWYSLEHHGAATLAEAAGTASRQQCLAAAP